MGGADNECMVHFMRQMVCWLDRSNERDEYGIKDPIDNDVTVLSVVYVMLKK